MTKSEFLKTRLGLEKLFGRDLPVAPDDLAALLWKQGYSTKEVKSFVRHELRDRKQFGPAPDQCLVQGLEK